MLDYTKVMKELYKKSSELFTDTSYECELVRVVWDVIAQDPHLYVKIMQSGQKGILPFWQGAVGAKIAIKKEQTHYKISAIDGSQIYPDRHQGTTCFLINIGTAYFDYSHVNTIVNLSSTPTVFLGNEYEAHQIHISHDIVNLIREEMEFKRATLYSNKQCDIIFLDGPLTFWFLDNKEQEVKDYFLSSYIASLWELYINKIPSIGYISMPRSKDIVSIIRAAIALLDHYQLLPSLRERDIVAAVALSTEQYKEKITARVMDSMICRWFLKPYERTILFAQSSSSIGDQYPMEIKPHFFYFHVGSEIVRIEIPAWVAHDSELLEAVCQIIIDQAAKGLGYPICLAEAHEQAVIKGTDREFFYQMLTKIGMTHKRRYVSSYKSMRKRLMNI